MAGQRGAQKTSISCVSKFNARLVVVADAGHNLPIGGQRQSTDGAWSGEPYRIRKPGITANNPGWINVNQPMAIGLPSGKARTALKDRRQSRYLEETEPGIIVSGNDGAVGREPDLASQFFGRVCESRPRN